MKISALLESAMDVLWLKHDLLANNVANAETPGYKRRDVNFQSYLGSALNEKMPLKATQAGHFAGGNNERLRVYQDLTNITPDGNSVDIDLEMAEVSTNALYYTSISKQLSAYFSMLRRATNEGRRQ
jgi:flagellar basal-body rod protein FlgB